MIGFLAYAIALAILYGLAMIFLPARAAQALLDATQKDWVLCAIGAVAIYAAVTI